MNETTFVIFIVVIMLGIIIGYCIWHNIKFKEVRLGRNTLRIVITTMLIMTTLYAVLRLFPFDSIFTESKVFEDVTRFCISMYATSFFALLYSITVEKNTNSRLEDISDNAPRTFPPNELKRPNKELFNELVDEIFNGKKYTYEGDNAVTASMCLYDVSTRLKKTTTKKIDVKLILEEYQVMDISDKEDDDEIKEHKLAVIDLFTTLYTLKRIIHETNKGSSFSITLYKKQPRSPHYHYINLTESSLFFSPYKKESGQYPLTFKFKNKGLFYKYFEMAMTERIEHWDSTIKISDNKSIIELLNDFSFSEFADKGYFDNKFSSKESRSSNAISGYFKKKFEDRKKKYGL